ncbi:MAG: pyruvate, phosphate dikinase/phosphoenolpyruvate synthase regulator [Gammaproteobacteria bacterium]|nr:pyruvate, phosphate dikinase/phosphoenolpyruvate synthase regulator [Gammaproteobacteria bacterium]
MSTTSDYSTRTVFFVSDGTAITAETMGRALLAQFEQHDFNRVTLPFIDNEYKAGDVAEVIARAWADDGVRPIVFSSLVDPELLKIISVSRPLVLDLFASFSKSLEQELQIESTHATGRFHGLVDQKIYDHRMEAVNFALAHDDGASLRHYEQASVILVGVSRTGKTPTSLYLAMQFGLKVANYPLTDDDLESAKLPGSLRAHRASLFGLTISAEQLASIRQERLPNSRYASVSQCRHEVEEAECLFRRNAVPYIDTTAISIEEISSKVIQTMGLARRLF